MKIHLLFIAILLFLKVGYAQEPYHPLVEENKTWYVVETGVKFESTTINKCEGDTVIANKLYKVVFFSMDEAQGYWSKMGYIREDDNHKVYFSMFHYDDPSFFEPELLYDFDAEVNDSLTITSIIYMQPHVMDIVITEIDSVMVDGAYRKRTWFKSEENDFWIEGIGDYTGLLSPGGMDFFVCPDSELHCVTKNGETIYPDGYSGSCWVVGIDEQNSQKNSFNISPNPVSNSFTVTPFSHLPSELLFGLYNSLGKIEISEKLYTDHPTRIMTGNLESGPYLYIISSKNQTIQKGKIIIR